MVFHKVIEPEFILAGFFGVHSQSKFPVMTVALCRWMRLRNIKFSKQPVRKIQTTHFARKILGCTSLGFALAKCEELNEEKHLKSNNLTREQCIKQACLLSVNSASTLLTTTSSALLDICKEYKDSLNRIMFLLEELETIEGENPELWDAVIDARSSVNKAKAALTELNSYMESVEKVVNSTTEAAFLAGAEYICTALCERLYSAQKEINNEIIQLQKMEEDYVKIQKKIASSKKKKGETKEIPLSTDNSNEAVHH